MPSGCHVLSHCFRLPDIVRAIGEDAAKLYYRMRDTLIVAHNKEVEQAVEAESEVVRELTSGHSVIICAECGQDIHWGNIRVHRRGDRGAVLIV